jgi:hypothetical protein
MCIKFCTELDRVGTQTYEMIKTAFQEDAMTCTHIFYWFYFFKNGCTSVASDKQVAEEVGVSFGSCRSILTKD